MRLDESVVRTIVVQDEIKGRIFYNKTIVAAERNQIELAALLRHALVVAVVMYYQERAARSNNRDRIDLLATTTVDLPHTVPRSRLFVVST